MKIFGRDTAKRHADIAVACQQILEDPSSNENHRAFAWNLIHDQRINEVWGEAWHYKYGNPSSRTALENAVTDYVHDLRAQPSASYAELDDPANNKVAWGARHAPQRNDLLVSVIDLWGTGARQVWKFGAVAEIGILGRFNLSEFDQPVPPRLLIDVLSVRDIREQTPLLTNFFMSYSAFLDEVRLRDNGPTPMATLNPVWVTLWDPWLKRVLIEDETALHRLFRRAHFGRASLSEPSTAYAWASSVGFSKTRVPTWIAVVKYPAWRAGELIRPTQLEAGLFGRHFPTPEICPQPSGGRMVEGRYSVQSRPDHEPLLEYIHQPVTLGVQDWISTELPILPTTQVIGNIRDLYRDRAAHWRALQKIFMGVPAWMEKPNG